VKKYTAIEIEKFLRGIDSFLKKKVSVIIIGGTAAALAYKVSMATQDIDTWNSTKDLKDAYEKAKKSTGLEIPLGQVSVGDAPINFEDRLEVFKPQKFKKLIVKVPEVGDLILMKTLRGYEHDLESIEEMVKTQKVKAEILTQRYATELGSAIGNKRVLDINFLAMIERCFGKREAEKSKKTIGFV